MTKSLYFRVLVPLVLTIILVAAAHQVLLWYVLPEMYQRTGYFWIYVFIVPVTLLANYLIIWRYTVSKTSMGKNFFAYTILKMIGTLGFLSPWLLFKTDLTKPFVYQFLLIFFILLFVETFLLIRVLNRKEA